MNEASAGRKSEGERRRGARSAIFLSAFLYPGAGQFAQGRWGFGLFYVLSTTVFVVLLLRDVLIPLFGMMQWAVSLAENVGRGMSDPQPPSLMRIGLWFVVSILLYAASLFDVVLAQRRLLRTQRESELLRKLEGKQP